MLLDFFTVHVLLYIFTMIQYFFYLQLKKNVLNVDFHVVRYGEIVEELRKEVGYKNMAHIVFHTRQSQLRALGR